jgi:biopolymer transport protein ExbD
MAMTATAAVEGDPIVEMNTTPLIDVLLVLLIMFIITLPILTHSTSLQLQGVEGGTLPETIYVDIDFDGAIVWNGTLVKDFNELEGYFRHEGARVAQADLQVRPDRRAQYDTVARVLALAQRNGMKRIGVSGGVDER